MREIKFRAWVKKQKRIAKVVDMYWDESDGGVCVEWGKLGLKCNFDEIELMQFTGLKDKNGKEIYEGDILRKKHTNMNKLKSENLIHKVVFSHGAFQLDNEVDEDFLDFDFDLHPSELEVIGNIYESPELVGRGIKV